MAACFAHHLVTVSRMTTRPLGFRLVCGLMCCVAALLPVGCGRPASQPSVAGSAPAELPTALAACSDPELKPLSRPAPRTTLPVAYPAAEIKRPILLARPFPLASPRPLSAAELSPPVVIEGPTAPRENGEPGPQLLPPTAPGTLTAPASPAVPDRLPSTASVPAPKTSLASQARPGRLPVTPPRPTARPPMRRSPAMRAVSQQAQGMIRHGYYLGQRGALYSARAEFVQALRTIAQALDVESGRRQNTTALAAGLTALEEAEDFVPEGSRLEADLDVPGLISVHQTPACKEMDAAALLPVIAAQHYYTYAQRQFAVAAGGQEAASMALFGLGKTYATLAVEKTLAAAVAEPKAMVFHWAALAADPGNFLAANELAVLYARWGEYVTARSLLQHSIAVLPHSAVWRNLAHVHQRLGEQKLAELARREADVAAKREAAAPPNNPDGIVASSDVQWLDVKEFAATSRTEVDVQKPAPAETKADAVKATPVVMPAPPRQRSAASWFPWFR